MTFPKVANEQRMTPEQYPGVPAGSYSYQANYSEGQINGYRWYDKHPDVKPAFPFGHGLVSSAFATPIVVSVGVLQWMSADQRAAVCN